jgi:hypothetical protein
VEIAHGPNGVGVRDSKNRTGGELDFGIAQWSRFVGTARNGTLDSP